MKYLTAFVIALGVIAAPRLGAQIPVKKGAKIAFTVSATTDIVQGLEGQKMSLNMATRSKSELKATKVAAGAIDWLYTISDAQMRVSSPMLPEGGVDSTLTVKPYNFSTDTRGQLTRGGENSEQLSAIMGAATDGNFSTDQFFSPTLRRELKVGESWEVTSKDTVNLPAVEGFRMVISRTVRHTYDGVVDTLKRKAHRVRGQTTKLALEGSGVAQGMNLTMSGDGNSHWVSYYAADENVLLASITESETNMRLVVTGGAEMAIPINQKTTVITARQ